MSRWRTNVSYCRCNFTLYFKLNELLNLQGQCFLQQTWLNLIPCTSSNTRIKGLRKKAEQVCRESQEYEILWVIGIKWALKCGQSHYRIDRLSGPFSPTFHVEEKYPGYGLVTATDAWTNQIASPINRSVWTYSFIKVGLKLRGFMVLDAYEERGTICMWAHCPYSFSYSFLILHFLQYI